MCQHIHSSAASQRNRKGYLTSPEAAEIAGVDRATVWRWVQRGWVEGKQVGIRWRIDPDSLHSFLGDIDGVPLADQLKDVTDVCIPEPRGV